MDFQFTSTIAHYLSGPAIGKQFATVFAITNIVSMCVQLLLTSFVMSRLGVGVALLFLPIAVLAGSMGFTVLPILWVGSSLNTVDNAFSYSINQSAKESLYVPTTKDEKYKAKAFGITVVFKDFSSIRWLSGFTIPIIIIWIFAVRYAGRKFSEMTE
jgi:AAA family ATP:ADP antiporter